MTKIEDERIPWSPRVERLGESVAELAPSDVAARLRHHGSLALLDSSGGLPRHFSLLGFDPVNAAPPDTLLGLRAYVERLARAGGDDVPGPFAGGFLGALSYDLGVAGEELALPRDPWNLPRIAGGLYTDFLVLDHDAGAAWLVLDANERDGRPTHEARRERILAELATPSPRRAFSTTRPLERLVDEHTYRARIEHVRDAIAAGDVYQVNLSHRFVAPTEGDPLDLYLGLRDLQPSPYGGFLRFAQGALASASPELLLALDIDSTGHRTLRTRPIKGTIARGATPAKDEANRATLRASQKDLAELAMIVDLERNDLGRVARPGTVVTGPFPELETYANVHHLVTDVHAEPRPDIDAIDVLAALFPGGSITGAPKLASMEHIAALEGEGRGFAFGALGFLDVTGRSCFNLLIRTLIWRPTRTFSLPAAPAASPGEVSYRVGGGITFASTSAAEDEETLIKGQTLARSLADTLG